MPKQDHFLSQRKRSQPMTLPHEFSDEELARDWTLSEADQAELGHYRKSSRVYLAVQLCAVRLYGRFVTHLRHVSPRIVNYLGNQLDLPPALTLHVPDREATYLEQRTAILIYLGFQKFDEAVQVQLATWLAEQTKQGRLSHELFAQAERYLLTHRILLPGPSVLERFIIHVFAEGQTQLFTAIAARLSPALRHAIDQLLVVPEGEQRSDFHQLKEYPPAATISSLQSYLKRYRRVSATGLTGNEAQGVTPALVEYLYKLVSWSKATTPLTSNGSPLTSGMP